MRSQRRLDMAIATRPIPATRKLIDIDAPGALSKSLVTRPADANLWFTLQMFYCGDKGDRASSVLAALTLYRPARSKWINRARALVDLQAIASSSRLRRSQYLCSKTASLPLSASTDAVQHACHQGLVSGAILADPRRAKHTQSSLAVASSSTGRQSSYGQRHWPVGTLSSSPTITVSFRPVLPLMRLSGVTSTVIPGFNTEAISFRNGSATLNRRRSSRLIA